MTLEIELSDEQLAKIADMVVAKLNGGKLASYTIAEAAEKLGISGRTIRNHIKAGIIPKIPGIGATRIPAGYVDGIIV
jgi:excisionase family DNA binding protein